MKSESTVRRMHLLRRGPGEAISTVMIGAGIAMLVQPFSLLLFTWSFPVILAGALAFLVTSHFPD